MRNPLYISLILLLFLPSCSKEDPAGSALPAVYNIVTTTDKYNVYTYNERDNSPLITLTADNADVTAFSEGKRILCRYVVNSEKSVTSKNITVYGLNTILEDKLRIADPEPLSELPKEEVKLYSIWRTGDYINMEFSVEYYNTLHQIMLVMDSSTKTNDTIDMYLCHNKGTDSDGFWRKAYASFDIGAAISFGAKAVRIHINNNNYDTKEYSFQINN